MSLIYWACTLFNIFWFLIWCSFQCVRLCLTGLLLSQQTLRFGGQRAESSRYQTISGEGLVFEFPVVHGSMCGPIAQTRMQPTSHVLYHVSSTTPELFFTCPLSWICWSCSWQRAITLPSAHSQFLYSSHHTWGSPGASRGKESACNAGDLSLLPGLGGSSGGGHGNPLQCPCLENRHGQRSRAGYSPWGHRESDTTRWLSTSAHSIARWPWIGTRPQITFVTWGSTDLGLKSSFTLPQWAFLVSISSSAKWG